MRTRVLYLIPCDLSENPYHGVLSTFNLEIIQKVKYFFSENIRTSRRFISSLKLGIHIEELKFIELTKDTTRAELKNILKEIPNEVDELGVMSEAGCPGIADPGSKLVVLAHELGWKVVPIAGPSSILLSLMASGFNGQNFHFHGYLPIKQEERVKALRKIEEDVLRQGTTHIFIETPFRNQAIFKDFLFHLKAETMICVASNLTSIDEYIKTKKNKDWQKNIPNIHKIPTIFLIGTTE